MYQPELPGLHGAASARGGLAVRTPSDRYSALLERHRQLLRQVEQARLRLTRLEETTRELGTRLAVQIEPLSERLQTLDREVHALFAELLQGRRLTGRARRLVREVYQQLQAGEVLSPQAAARAGVSDGDPAPRGGPAPRPLPEDDLPSAARPEATNGKGALRATFLRLAQALHPDRASNAADAQSREEAMKAVNRAYHEGDLARLLEIQQLWAFSGSAGSPTDEIAQREKALEETNQALQQQLTALRRACRQLQRSDIGRMVNDMKRSPGDPGERFIQEGREEIERMVQLRDFVRAFRDGEISLETFVAGPDDSGPDELDEELEAAVNMLADWIERSTAAPPRAPRKRNRKRSSRPRR